MIRTALAATTLLAAAPLSDQSTTQEELDARYDRALAAGYKALMLCSAIASAEATGIMGRTPESVHEWELSGIQQPLDAIIRDQPYQIVREEKERGGTKLSELKVNHLSVYIKENMKF